jgi:hypothetical protein
MELELLGWEEGSREGFFAVILSVGEWWQGAGFPCPKWMVNGAWWMSSGLKECVDSY